MVDTLTILTTDDPPVSLIASRILLATTSKGFADMLSVPRATNDNEPITVAEKKVLFEPFLRVLECGEVELDRVEWEALARVGDKYDSWAVKQAVEKRVWKLEAKKEDHLHSFTLATIVGDKDLLECTALRALQVKNRGSVRFGATREWQQRLDLYEALRTARAFASLKAVQEQVHGYVHCESICNDTTACHRHRTEVPIFIARMITEFDPADEVLSLLPRYTAAAPGETCMTIKCRAICSAVDESWRTTPPSFASVYWFALTAASLPTFG
ncbi:hypothetical protein JCM3770_007420 [Rhodotorula araucariae]